MNQYLRHFNLAMFLALFSISSVAEEKADKVITLSFWQHPSENVLWRWGELVYTEAFKRLGYNFRYQVYPATRASYLADRGLIDGEASRIDSYGHKHPNLIRVETNIIKDILFAYAVKPEIKIDNLSSLNKANYRIEYLRGLAGAEQYLPQLIIPEQLSSVDTAEQGFRKLLADRTDIYIDSPVKINHLSAKAEFKNIFVAGELMRLSAYPYLHKKHQDLAPKLAKVLKDMKQQGLFDQYKTQVLEEVKDNVTTKHIFLDY